MIEETINKVFDEKPSDIMKELITGYYTSYKKEVICKHRYMQMETMPVQIVLFLVMFILFCLSYG